MTKRKNMIISLVINIVIVLVTAGVVISYFLGNDGEYHIPPNFRFCLFTTDSNILCALSALVMAVFEARYLKTGREIPKAAVVFKLIGSTAVALTFVVVVVFLGPLMGFVSMVFGGTSFYMHFSGPILAFVSFCFFENVHHISKRLMLMSLIPTILYAIVYLTMVLIIGEENGGWYDFYSFNMGGFWYLSSTAIMLVTLGLGAVLRFVHNKRTKKLKA